MCQLKVSGEAIEVDDMLCAELDFALQKNLEARRTQSKHMRMFSGDLKRMSRELRSNNGNGRKDNGGKSDEPDDGNTAQPTD